MAYGDGAQWIHFAFLKKRRGAQSIHFDFLRKRRSGSRFTAVHGCPRRCVLNLSSASGAVAGWGRAGPGLGPLGSIWARFGSLITSIWPPFGAYLGSIWEPWGPLGDPWEGLERVSGWLGCGQEHLSMLFTHVFAYFYDVYKKVQECPSMQFTRTLLVSCCIWLGA